MKYITLTMLLVLEFLVISAFVVTPIEHSFMFWIYTILLFEGWDQVKEMERDQLNE
ncbi:hypothetical protein [Mammaliicoccus sciuri]|uniref:hypothetical protein n=1 Tax=Mammaliicoccus sciuri TaxID=1296 RepID=UPI00195314AE|nr:hypothetical protein [Mammaliicoccus sciuri]